MRTVPASGATAEAEQDAQQGRLAHAIGADDADAVAAQEGGGIIVHDDAIAEGLAHVSCNSATSFSPSAAALRQWPG